jgi:hypothetical protein
MDRGLISIVDGRVVITLAPDGTVWMSKHQIADLFGCFVAKVVSNIAVILKSGVLDESRVRRFHRYKDGGGVELYSLEMVAALAFRIRSHNAEVFRQWLMERVTKPPQYYHLPIQVFVPIRENMFLN